MSSIELNSPTGGSSFTPGSGARAAALPAPFSSLSQDLPAGLVVFLVALPLCLGISLASGAPLLSGVVSGIVAGMLVSWLSGSQLSVSGPAAGLTVIMLSAIATLGSFQTVLAATVVAGAIQVLLGVAKAGIVGLYFPAGVIRGMLAAIGLILILKQIPHFIGFDVDNFADMNFLQADGQNTFSELLVALQTIRPGAALIGLTSLLIILLWDSKWLSRFRLVRLVPSALVAVLAAIALNQLLGVVAPAIQVQAPHLVSLPVLSSLGELAGQMTFPRFADFGRPAVYTVGFTIAIVASLETLLSVEAVDKLDPHKRRTPTNRELMAQGAGNMVSGLLGGLPMTAVIVRSSANVAAGAQTRLSSFVHGALLLTSLLFLGTLLNRIPLAALAAVLLVVGFKLTRPALYRLQWRLGWQQFLPFIVTVVAILFTDLLKGVGIGLIVGIFFILKANAEKAYFLDRNLEGSEPGPLHLRLSEHVSFLNKASIVSALEGLPAGSHIVLDGSKTVDIDHDVLEAIESFRRVAPERNINLELRGIREVAVAGH